jgi:predicted nucleic acid-binding protein
LAGVIALDASVLIAHLWPQDEHHSVATELLREHAGRDFAIHSLNLAEVLVGGARIGQGEQMLRDIEEIGVLAATPLPGEALRLARLRAETRLKLPDCCALDTARSIGAPLATMDTALASAARSLGIAVLP